METKHKFKRRNSNTGRWKACVPRQGVSYSVKETFVTYDSVSDLVVFTHYVEHAPNVSLREGGHHVDTSEVSVDPHKSTGSTGP